MTATPEQRLEETVERARATLQKVREQVADMATHGRYIAKVGGESDAHISEAVGELTAYLEELDENR